jgi:hypothetical protein
MQTEPDPSPGPSAGSAVGLAFVAIVLVSLFAAGALGVVATRAGAPAPAAAADPEPDPAAAASAQAAVLARDRIVARFKELMLLREIALRERDPGLLESVYAAGAPGLAGDRAEIERLRDADRRLAGRRLPVRVFNAYRPGDGSWVVIARLGRSAAREVTGSGRQVRATRGSAAVYRCTLVRRDGSWRVLRLVRS